MRIHALAIAILTGLMLLANASAEPGRQAQATNPPNNSTPGTATANVPRPIVYKVDTHEITLRPKQGIEYKYQMEKGAVMVYSWKATGGLVNHEFHGEPNGAPRGYADTYLKEDAKDQSHGAFVAPSTGIHGWYWENTADKDVTVAITAAGFFSTAYTIDRNGRVPKELPDANSLKGR
jgi:hypothetical protein